MPLVGRQIRPGLRQSLRFQMDSGDFPVPVFWLKFGENTGAVAKDSSPEGNDGAIEGATWAKGILGSGLSFDGLDDYVEVAADPSLTFDGVITVEVWVKPVDILTDRTIVHGTLTGDYSESWWVEIFESRPVCSINGQYEYAIFPKILEAEKWQHLVMTYDKALAEKNIQAYVNGALWGWKDYTGDVADEDGVTIGRTGDGLFAFSGVIDEIRVYDVALSARQVLELYYGIG